MIFQKKKKKIKSFYKLIHINYNTGLGELHFDKLHFDKWRSIKMLYFPKLHFASLHFNK